MTLERVYDGARLMRVIRHPSVWPHVSLGVDDFDISPLASDPDNVMLVNDHGGFGFIKREDGIYEQHTAFLPEGRRGEAFMAGREALWYLFTHTDCIAIRSFVTEENRVAAGYARKLGFSEIGDCEINGYPSKVLFLSIKAWARGLGEYACRG